MAPTEKKILLLGTGYVAGPCLAHLLRRPENIITIASRKLENATKLANQYNNPRILPKSLDVENKSDLDLAVSQHDLVISLIPYTQHVRVIECAVKHKKHVVTTSYISPAMASFDQAAKDANITIFNEIGVDPGVDHLYAIKTIDDVHKHGGKIVSFVSYCGGLPAPESSNNPLGYKFSWSSRGVLLALKNTARYLMHGEVVEVVGEELMGVAKRVYVYPAYCVVGYPNRDSTGYGDRYGIPECKTLIRGTLRYEGFPDMIRVWVVLGLLKDDVVDWLQVGKMDIKWRDVIGRCVGVGDNKTEEEVIEAVKTKCGLKGELGDRILRGMKWLGLFSDMFVEKRGTLLDTLCATLEQKMQYGKGERDMVLLQHTFGIEYPDGKKETRTSTGIWYGDPVGQVGGVTAMARTVGVPCGVVAQMVMDGVMTVRGVVAPVTSDVVYPIIRELEKEGITMVEEVI